MRKSYPTLYPWTCCNCKRHLGAFARQCLCSHWHCEQCIIDRSYEEKKGKPIMVSTDIDRAITTEPESKPRWAQADILAFSRFDNEFHMVDEENMQITAPNIQATLHSVPHALVKAEVHEYEKSTAAEARLWNITGDGSSDKHHTITIRQEVFEESTPLRPTFDRVTEITLSGWDFTESRNEKGVVTLRLTPKI